jgi:hypothetical protein
MKAYRAARRTGGGNSRRAVRAQSDIVFKVRGAL